MKNLLVPIGSNENERNTLEYAIEFAREFNSRIYLIHVYSSSKVSGSFKNVDHIIEKDSKEVLREHLKSVDSDGVEIITSTLKGHSESDTLKQMIKLLHIDVIIASTKNDGSDETTFIGKTTGNIIKDTEIPVLVIPAEVKFRPVKKILMTIKSGSIKSLATLDVLISIQKHFDSTINLLQVKTPKLDSKDLELNKTLESLVANRIQTRNATVFQGVLEHLHEENPDMLCVIRRKRGFFKKLWQDDRVKKIDFDSNIPLLVLKGLS